MDKGQPVAPVYSLQDRLGGDQAVSNASGASGSTPLKDVQQATEKQDALTKKVAGAHKPLFFDNDFSYLCDRDYNGLALGDALKKRCLPGGGSFDIGGEYRMRAHFEQNIRGLGLTGTDDQFLLHRTRLYGDFRISPDVRFFAEMLDAESNFENFGPRSIEVNRVDMQNLFVDARLLAGSNGTLTARVGRQELLFGNQRLVSPLDWANTRRTFEGANLIWKQNEVTLNTFWTQPVQVEPGGFDSPDREQEFMGLYSSFTGKDKQTIDAYLLRYLNRRGANDFAFNTTGLRWQGSQGDILWDTEAAVQFGDNTDGSSHGAGMFTLGLGRKFSSAAWNPVVWAYYDYASGDGVRGGGNGFHHNFPLAHKYNGFMDLFGRRNLEDVNFQLSLQPNERVKLLLWYHYFFLATQSDTPYSVIMTPFNPGNAPGSSDLGHEVDLLGSFTISSRSNLVLGYSHFFSGDYYSTTSGVPYDGDASFFYSQWTVSF